MVRPKYPFVHAPEYGRLWPKGTIVDAIWKGLWWKGKVKDTKPAEGDQPAKVLVQFPAIPEGEGGPMLWRSMDKTRKALVWDLDHKARKKYLEQHEAGLAAYREALQTVTL